MNDLLEPLRRRSKLIIIAGTGLVLLSVVLGIAIGLAKRSTALNREPKIPLSEVDTIQGEDKPGPIVPPPLAPDLVENPSGYFSYFDLHYELIEEMAPIPLSNEDLLRYRRPGLTSDVRPFNFMGEELDILTYDKELAEP